MAFLIGGANSAADTGFNIDNSIRFNDGDSAYLYREFTADPDSRKKFTFSFWVKMSEISQDGGIVSAKTTSNFYSRIFFETGDTIRLQNYSSGNEDILYRTSGGYLFKDPSAWYHIVFVVDTSESNGNNGIKLYINGVFLTDYSISTYNQNATFEFGRSGTTMGIGRDEEGSMGYFDGYLSEFYYIDNQTLAASNFGETDEDSGIWKPKTYEGSYGANGFFLEFKNSAVGSGASDTIGADTSGNDEHFTSTNVTVLDQCTDSPTNNFATLNPLAITNSNSTLAEGNLQHTVSGQWLGAYTTIGAQNGKWYAEAKCTDAVSISVGVIKGGGDSVENFNTGNLGYIGKYDDGWGWWGNGSASDKVHDNTSTSLGSTISNDDIMMIALDIDNGDIFFGTNGTWLGSADPAAGSNPAFNDQTMDDFMFFASGNEDGTVQWNFGSPPFAISSSNADANGYGNFEYAVPSGYYALCTKNLAEFG